MQRSSAWHVVLEVVEQAAAVEDGMVDAAVDAGALDDDASGADVDD